MKTLVILKQLVITFKIRIKWFFEIRKSWERKIIFKPTITENCGKIKGSKNVDFILFMLLSDTNIKTLISN